MLKRSAIMVLLLGPRLLFASQGQLGIELHDVSHVQSAANSYITNKQVITVDISISGCSSGTVQTRLNGEVTDTLTFPSDAGGEAQGIKEAPSPGPRSSLLVRLRPAGNLLRFVLQCKDGDMYVETRQIFQMLGTPELGHQWAVVVKPESDGRSKTSTNVSGSNSDFLEDTLKNSFFIPNVIGLTDTKATASAVRETILNLTQKMKPHDQLLFYYIGGISIARGYQSPILYLSGASMTPGDESQGLEVAELLRLLASSNLPSVSVVIDGYLIPVKANETSVLQDYLASTNAAASWLKILQYHPSAELMFSLKPGPSSQEEISSMSSLSFTDALLQYLREGVNGPAAEMDSCASLETIWRNWGPITRSSASTQRRPIYFSSSQGRAAFCFHKELPRTITIESSKVEPEILLVKGTLPNPAGISRMSVAVNQVIVSRQAPAFENGKFQIQVPFPRGHSLVTLSCERNGHVAYSGSFEIEGLDEVDSLSLTQETTPATIFIYEPRFSTGTSDEFSRSSQGDIGNSYLKVVQGTLDLDTTVNVPSGKSLQYFVEKNGVLLDRKHRQVSQNSDNFGFRTSIPLDVGLNYVSVVAQSETAYQAKHFVVERVARNQLAALLIGIDQYSDSRIPSLSFAGADAKEMREALLANTDLYPEDVRTLINERATKQNILAYLSSGNLGETLLGRDSEEGEDELTLVLYFAGYGTTIIDTDSKNEIRCLLPFDTIADDIKSQCISTSDLSSTLDRSKFHNSILILDTSYDGVAGSTSIRAPGGIAPATSRTLSTYVSADRTWRLSAGADYDRLILTAGQTNEAALESIVTQHGILTSAILDRISQAKAANSFPISFSDLFSRIAFFVSSLTAGGQNPILKGNNSHSLMLRNVEFWNLREEWIRALGTIYLDTLMMRKINPVLIMRAERAASKAAEINPSQGLAYTGLGMVANYRSILTCREGQTEECMHKRMEAGSLLEASLKLEDREQQKESDSRDPYLAHLALCIFRLQEGDFSNAREACSNAISYDPAAVRAKFYLSMVYLAQGEQIKAADTLDSLLDHDKRKAFSTFLTPEEWGKAVIWRAMLLHEDSEGAASVVLKKYIHPEMSEMLFVKTFEHTPFLELAFRNNKRRILNTSDLPPSRWAKQVAQFLLGDPSLSSDSDLSFPNDSDTDLQALACEIEFYRGPRASWHHDRSAREHFSASFESGASDHLELWLAKQQIETVH